MKPAMPNLKVLPYGGASAVEDPEMLFEVSTLLAQADFTQWLDDQDIHHRFLESYRTWVTSSRYNNLRGLNSFPVACYSLGTSESFDKFYLKNHTRRFRCFRGEYMYHAAAWRNYFPGWCYLDQDDIDSNDAVVISMPFSDTGDVHPETMSVLDQCDRLGVPVLMDAAFYGICSGIDFDYNRECITDITFSLSKTFPISHVRIGMRLTRDDDDDSLLVHHKSSYINRIGSGLGIELMQRWGADYNHDRWHQQQHIFCQQLGVVPSKTVIFGLDGGTRPEYNRGNTTNRLCFARYLYKKALPHD